MPKEVHFPQVYPLKVVGFSRSSEVTLDDIIKLVGGSSSIVISIRSLEPISHNDFSTSAEPYRNLDWKPASISKCLSSADNAYMYLLSVESKDGPETAIVSVDTLTNHWGLCYRSPVLPKLPLAQCSFLANGSWSDELVDDFLRRRHIVNGMDDEELHPSVRHKILVWKLLSEISTNPSLDAFGNPTAFLQFLNDGAHTTSISSAVAAPANIVADAAAAAGVLYWPSPVPVFHFNCHSCQLGGNLQPPIVLNLLSRPANGNVPSFLELASGDRWDLGAASTVTSLHYHVQCCREGDGSELPFFPLDIWHEQRFVPPYEQLIRSEAPHACDVGRIAGHNRHVFRLYDASHSVVVEFVRNVRVFIVYEGKLCLAANLKQRWMKYIRCILIRYYHCGTQKSDAMFKFHTLQKRISANNFLPAGEKEYLICSSTQFNEWIVAVKDTNDPRSGSFALRPVPVQLGNDECVLLGLKTEAVLVKIHDYPTAGHIRIREEASRYDPSKIVFPRTLGNPIPADTLEHLRESKLLVTMDKNEVKPYAQGIIRRYVCDLLHLYHHEPESMRLGLPFYAEAPLSTVGVWNPDKTGTGTINPYYIDEHYIFDLENQDDHICDVSIDGSLGSLWGTDNIFDLDHTIHAHAAITEPIDAHAAIAEPIDVEATTATPLTKNAAKTLATFQGDTIQGHSNSVAVSDANHNSATTTANGSETEAALALAGLGMTRTLDFNVEGAGDGKEAAYSDEEALHSDGEDCHSATIDFEGLQLSHLDQSWSEMIQNEKQGIFPQVRHRTRQETKRASDRTNTAQTRLSVFRRDLYQKLRRGCDISRLVALELLSLHDKSCNGLLMVPKYINVIEGDDTNKEGLNGCSGISAILLTMHLHRIPVTLKTFQDVILHIAPPFLQKVRENRGLQEFEILQLEDVVLPLVMHGYFPKEIEWRRGNIMGEDLDQFLKVLDEKDEGGAIFSRLSHTISILKMPDRTSTDNTRNVFVVFESSKHRSYLPTEDSQVKACRIICGGVPRLKAFLRVSWSNSLLRSDDMRVEDCILNDYNGSTAKEKETDARTFQAVVSSSLVESSSLVDVVSSAKDKFQPTVLAGLFEESGKQASRDISQARRTRAEEYLMSRAAGAPPAQSGVMPRGVDFDQMERDVQQDHREVGLAEEDTQRAVMHAQERGRESEAAWDRHQVGKEQEEEHAFYQQEHLSGKLNQDVPIIYSPAAAHRTSVATLTSPMMCKLAKVDSLVDETFIERREGNTIFFQHLPPYEVSVPLKELISLLDMTFLPDGRLEEAKFRPSEGSKGRVLKLESIKEHMKLPNHVCISLNIPRSVKLNRKSTRGPQPRHEYGCFFDSHCAMRHKKCPSKSRIGITASSLKDIRMALTLPVCTVCGNKMCTCIDRASQPPANPQVRPEDLEKHVVVRLSFLGGCMHEANATFGKFKGKKREELVKKISGDRSKTPTVIAKDARAALTNEAVMSGNRSLGPVTNGQAKGVRSSSLRMKRQELNLTADTHMNLYEMTDRFIAQDLLWRKKMGDTDTETLGLTRMLNFWPITEYEFWTRDSQWLPVALSHFGKFFAKIDLTGNIVMHKNRKMLHTIIFISTREGFLDDEEGSDPNASRKVPLFIAAERIANSNTGEDHYQFFARLQVEWARLVSIDPPNGDRSATRPSFISVDDDEALQNGLLKAFRHPDQPEIQRGMYANRMLLEQLRYEWHLVNLKRIHASLANAQNPDGKKRLENEMQQTKEHMHSSFSRMKKEPIFYRICRAHHEKTPPGHFFSKKVKERCTNIRKNNEIFQRLAWDVMKKYARCENVSVAIPIIACVCAMHRKRSFEVELSTNSPQNNRANARVEKEIATSINQFIQVEAEKLRNIVGGANETEANAKHERLKGSLQNDWYLKCSGLFREMVERAQDLQYCSAFRYQKPNDRKGGELVAFHIVWGCTVENGQASTEKLTRMDSVRLPSLPAQEGETITIDNPLYSYEAAGYWSKVVYKASIGTNSLVAKYKMETGGGTSDNNQGAEGGFKNIKHNTDSRPAAMEELAVYMNEVHSRIRDQELAMSTAARFLDDHMTASRARRRAGASARSASVSARSASVSDQSASDRPAKRARLANDESNKDTNDDTNDAANDAAANDTNKSANNENGMSEVESEEEIIESQWCRRNKSFDQLISEIKMHSQGQLGGVKEIHIRLLIYVAKRLNFEHPTYEECKNNEQSYRSLIQSLNKYVPSSSTFTRMFSVKYKSKPSSTFVKWMKEYRDHLEALSDHHKAVAIADANAERGATGKSPGGADIPVGSGTDSQPSNARMNTGLSASMTEMSAMKTVADAAEADEGMNGDGPVNI